MSSVVKNNPVQGEESMDSRVHEILGILGKHHADKAQGAKDGQNFLQMGIKTEDAQYVESVLNNPVQFFIGNKKKSDGQMNTMLTLLLTAHLSKYKELIRTAYKTDLHSDDLHFCVNLKEDTIDNRILINDFFETYRYMCDAECPLYIQFVSDKIVDMMKPETVLL